jgi:hypothetical protein
MIIISQPKAGTYLCSEIVKNLGLHQTYMHLSQLFYSQYDSDRMFESRRFPKKFQVKKPLEESVDLIEPNSFAVTHVDCTPENIKLFDRFKKVVLVRDINEILVSRKRWLQESGRAVTNSGKQKPKKWTRERIERLSDWTKVDNTFVLQFNQMIGKDVEAIDRLQLFLFNEIKHNSLDVIEKSLQAETFTKSSKR